MKRLDYGGPRYPIMSMLTGSVDHFNSATVFINATARSVCDAARQSSARLSLGAAAIFVHDAKERQGLVEIDEGFDNIPKAFKIQQITLRARL